MAVGKTEYLKTLFVFGNFKERRASFTVNYRVRGSTGSPTEGSFVYETLFERNVNVDSDAVMKRLDAATKLIGAENLEDIFLVRGKVIG